MTQVQLTDSVSKKAPPRATIARLVWSGEGVPAGRMLAGGALVWSLYAVFVVLLYGVIMDQDLLPAQVITGAVHYPSGHPALIFYPRVFNLPTYLFAGFLALSHDAVLFSALRNWIFAFLSAFVPFAIAAVLTRKPAWGHAAALFTYSEAARQFRGVYPSQIFPDFNSDGHIGMHVAVLIVFLLMACLWRWGGALLGLLPAIHPTMAVVIWPWSLCYLYIYRRRIGSRERKCLLVSVCAGLAVCGALAGYIWLTAPPIQHAPPYDSQANGPVLYQQFEATTDAHRQPLTVVSPAYLIQPLALVALIVLYGWKNRESRRLVAGMILFSLLIWSYVGGAWLFQRIFHWLPTAVRISMPGRFSNLTAMLLIPLAVALIARSRPAATIFSLLFLVQAALTPQYHEFLRLYFIYVIWGAALVACIWLGRERPEGRSWQVPSWCPPIAFLIAVAVSLGVPSNAAWADLRARTPGYRIKPYDRQLSAWLASNARPDEPILVPSGPVSELQTKTGHPVIMELETLYMMTYKPDLAAVIGPMAEDFYGIDYAHPDRLRPVMNGGRIFPGSSRLTAVWQSRTAAEWQALRRKYNFRLVLSLSDIPLPLKPVLPGSRWTLYSIE